MDDAYGEMGVVKVWASKRPYKILGFISTMVNYEV